MWRVLNGLVEFLDFRHQRYRGKERQSAQRRLVLELSRFAFKSRRPVEIVTLLRRATHDQTQCIRLKLRWDCKPFRHFAIIDGAAHNKHVEPAFAICFPSVANWFHSRRCRHSFRYRYAKVVRLRNSDLEKCSQHRYDTLAGGS